MVPSGASRNAPGVFRSTTTGCSVPDASNRLKRTWGEQIAGNLSVGFVFGLIGFLVFLVGAVSSFLAFSLSTVLGITVVALFAALLVIVSLISSTLSGIYKAAVYQYAISGKSGGFFDQATIENAFKRR